MVHAASHPEHDHGDDHDHDGHGHGGSRHAHSHDGAHHHNHSHSSSGARVGIAAFLTGGFMLAEVIGGVMAGSLALLADAGHMVSDFASLLLAWVGFRIATRPADSRRTYGFARFSVLAAFTNGIALAAIAVWILVEAALRLFEPHEVMSGLMLWVAAGGLAVNILSFAILHGADRDNLNVRGALAHVAGDLLGSVAAIAAAVIIMTTGWMPADPLLSAVVAIILLRSAWSITRDAGHVLLEGAPGHIDLDAVVGDLSSGIEGVEDVHHAHVWSLDGRQPMMTLHARIAADANAAALTSAIRSRLKERYGVDHATIEIETDDCPGHACAPVLPP